MGMKLGIDLGTSYTVVSTYQDGNLQPLNVFYGIMGDKSARSPSFQLLENGNRTIGKLAMKEFERIYKEEREKLGNSVDIFYEYKRRL